MELYGSKEHDLSAALPVRPGFTLLSSFCGIHWQEEKYRLEYLKLFKTWIEPERIYWYHSFQ